REDLPARRRRPEDQEGRRPHRGGRRRGEGRGHHRDGGAGVPGEGVPLRLKRSRSALVLLGGSGFAEAEELRRLPALRLVLVQRRLTLARARAELEELVAELLL